MIRRLDRVGGPGSFGSALDMQRKPWPRRRSAKAVIDGCWPEFLPEPATRSVSHSLDAWKVSRSLPRAHHASELTHATGLQSTSLCWQMSRLGLSKPSLAESSHIHPLSGDPRYGISSATPGDLHGGSVMPSHCRSSHVQCHNPMMGKVDTFKGWEM